MTAAEQAMKILVFSEDSATNSHATIAALLKKMFRFIDGQAQTNLMEFLPRTEEDQNVLAGQQHKAQTQKGHQARTFLAGRIVDHIVQDRVFVAYHADGDKKWSERAPNIEDDFRDFVGLREAVLHRLQSPPGLRRRGVVKSYDPALATKLLLLAAYWEIEAWLYQNIKTARIQCQANHPHGRCKIPSEWEANRASLDNVEHPKDACCLKALFNQVLAEDAYPIDEAYNADTSLAATINRMLECVALMDALKQTHWKPAQTASE